VICLINPLLLLLMGKPNCKPIGPIKQGGCGQASELNIKVIDISEEGKEETSEDEFRGG